MKLLRKVFKVILIIVGCVAIFLAGFLVVGTIFEYNPEEIESVEISQGKNFEKSTDSENEKNVENTEEDQTTEKEAESSDLPTLSIGDDLTIMTWNIGYGSLGDNADFFMDGGTSVKTADEERIEENMTGIAEIVQSIDPDIAFFQEVDINANRSEYRNELEDIRNILPGYNNAFAYNYNVLYIPYPIPPLGHVEAGVVTATSFGMEDAERYSLPNPFKWPIRLFNLKRCMLVSRIPVEGTDKLLVLVNFHLEAYDDGEGKKAQTALLKSFLEKEAEAGNYVIAGGDFNQTFSSVDISAYPAIEGNWQPGIMDAAEYEDEFNVLMDNKVPSCRSLKAPYTEEASQLQYYVIDGFIFSKNIEIENYENIDAQFKYSDHNPLVVNFKIAG